MQGEFIVQMFLLVVCIQATKLATAPATAPVSGVASGRAARAGMRGALA
jgi:hypothetical protein